MKQIHCVVFDFGGVISYLQSREYAEKIRVLVNLEENLFRDLYRRYRPEYDSGFIDGFQYWNRFFSNNDPGKDSLIRQIIQLDVESWTIINNSIIQLINKLHALPVKTAILSNIHFDALHSIEERYGWLENIDYKIYSCMEKCIKPDEEIYLRCLSKTACSPDECLFIDDTRENILAAEKLGFHTIHYIGYDQLINEIELNYTFSSTISL